MIRSGPSSRRSAARRNEPGAAAAPGCLLWMATLTMIRSADRGPSSQTVGNGARREAPYCRAAADRICYLDRGRRCGPASRRAVAGERRAVVR